MRGYSVRKFTLENEVWLPRKRDEVFHFFADAWNLERLTPPFLRFEVLTPAPIEVRAGTMIDYRLKLHRIPVRWRSEITVWEPPYRFVDEQRRGPYRRWVHEHSFTEKDGGTLACDHVEYAVLGGIVVQKLLVGRDLKKIFSYRNQQLQAIIGD
jgi:ligand-binding SRPBCC domain-containing protein